MVFAKSFCHKTNWLCTSKVIKPLQTGCILHVADSGQIKDEGIFNFILLAKQQNINQINSGTGEPVIL